MMIRFSSSSEAASVILVMDFAGGCGLPVALCIGGIYKDHSQPAFRLSRRGIPLQAPGKSLPDSGGAEIRRVRGERGYF